jgi:hypothetical protein
LKSEPPSAGTCLPGEMPAQAGPVGPPEPFSPFREMSAVNLLFRMFILSLADVSLAAGLRAEVNITVFPCLPEGQGRIHVHPAHGILDGGVGGIGFPSRLARLHGFTCQETEDFFQQPEDPEKGEKTKKE